MTLPNGSRLTRGFNVAVTKAGDCFAKKGANCSSV